MCLDEIIVTSMCLKTKCNAVVFVPEHEAKEKQRGQKEKRMKTEKNKETKKLSEYCTWNFLENV